MVLISFKYILTWLSYGIRFFAIAIFGPIGLKFFMKVRETIIYRLVICLIFFATI